MKSLRLRKPKNLAAICMQTALFMLLCALPGILLALLFWLLLLRLSCCFVTTIKKLPNREQKKHFVRRLFFSKNMQKLILGTVLIYLMRAFLSEIAKLDYFFNSSYFHASHFLTLISSAVLAYLAAFTLLRFAYRRLIIDRKDLRPAAIQSSRNSPASESGRSPALESLAGTDSFQCSKGKERARMELRQAWIDSSFFIFSFLGIVFVSLLAFGDTGDYLANWLIASGRDANLMGIGTYTAPEVFIFPGNKVVWKLPESSSFILFIKFIFVAVLLWLSFVPIRRFSAYLVSVIERAATRCLTELLDAPAASFLEALKSRTNSMYIAERNILLKHGLASVSYVLFCYLLLFGLFGLSGGPLGNTICQWFDCSLTGAGFGVIHVKAIPQLHWFCGAIVALYGTIPLAVTGCIFLPFFERKKIEFGEEGIFFPDGNSLFSMGFRSLRSWDDFERVEIKSSKSADLKRKELKVKFRSGGSLSLGLSQLSSNDMHKLISAIDEHASLCQVTDDVIAVKQVLAREELTPAGDGAELREEVPENFMSTVFVPIEPGDYLPGRKARVVRLLASKPLAAVYLVRAQDGELLVVKQFYLADQSKETKALIKAFQRECELLKTLEHPRISRVLDSFQDGLSSFIILEHSSGVDLRSYVQDVGRRSESVVLDWAEQLAEIVIYLHEQNQPVLHRDLTPDNIVIGHDGALHLIDFGAAHQFLEGITGTMIGKQCYTAPEQLRGSASPRSDIYSFACTLYYLLTGEDPVALLQASAGAIVPVSPALDSLIRACTEFDESKRPQNFNEVLSWLRTCKRDPWAEYAQYVCAGQELENLIADPDSALLTQEDEASVGGIGCVEDIVNPVGVDREELVGVDREELVGVDRDPVAGNSEVFSINLAREESASEPVLAYDPRAGD